MKAEMVEIPESIYAMFPQREHRCPSCGTYFINPVRKCPLCGRWLVETSWLKMPRWRKSRRAMSDYAHNILSPILTALERAKLLQWFTVHFTADFEEGIAGNPLGTPPWTTQAGNANYQNTVVKSGSLGGQCTFTVAGTDEARKYPSVGPTVDNYVILWLRFDGVPDANQEVYLAYLRDTVSIDVGLYLRLLNVGGIAKWGIRYITFGNVSNFAVSNLSLPAINTWYKMKLFIHRDAVAGAVKLSVNGSELIDISQSGLNLGVINPNWIGLQAVLTAGTAGQIAYFDDVLWQDIDDVSFGGSGRVDMLNVLLGM